MEYDPLYDQDFDNLQQETPIDIHEKTNRQTTSRTDILASLNDQQRAAVLARDGAVLIVAGAGSGKTRVLTSRLAMLLQDGVKPHSILALTFTKKAAEEMRGRIREMAGSPADHLVMGTFHSVFVRFLREYHDYIGFPSSFTILDEEDSKSCLRQCIMEVLFGPQWDNKEEVKKLSDEEAKDRKRLIKTYKVDDIKSRISLLKNDYIVPKDYLADNMLQANDRRKSWDKLGEIYRLYMNRCKKSNTVDFDDILVYTYFLMEKYPDVAKELARRFRYILVDEYQDTNAIQYSIIRTLSLGHGNICVVGDDSQSIYAFRGARIGNILSFRNDYPDYKTFKLETNYRSTTEIVEAANRLIEYNEGRIPKTCVASRGSGKAIGIQYLRNDRDEARYIANTIQKKHDRGAAYADNAVLYRTNAQSRALEDALMKAHIPYVIYSGISFFERQEVKDLLAYLRLVVNHNDDEAFKRICNRPARGISENTVSVLTALGSVEEKTLYEVAAHLDDYQHGLKGSAVKSVGEFVKLLDSFAERDKNQNALESARQVLDESGLYDYYLNEKDDDDGRKRTSNLTELLNGIRYYVEDQLSGDTYDIPDESLSAYLENIALLSAVDRQKDSVADRVKLMTSHCSKGLEFPTVFIAGCEEDLYPSLRDKSNEGELEEERRLFYVSITRAKDELILCSCENRWQYGQMKECEVSRFLNEMFD